MTNRDLLPGSNIIDFWNNYNHKTDVYTEGYQVLPDMELHYGDISLQSEGIDIPYNGKILRITVSEWATIELLDEVEYTNAVK